MKKFVSGLLLIGCLAGAAVAEPHPYDSVRLGPGDWADMGSTAFALGRDGIEEANPILAPFGDAVPLVGMGLKYGMKHGMVAMGHTPAQANVTVETVGMLGFCNNVAVLAGAEPHLSLTIGVICAIANKRHMTKRYERETGKHLNGAPVNGMQRMVETGPGKVLKPQVIERQKKKGTAKSQNVSRDHKIIRDHQPFRDVQLPKTDASKGRAEVFLDTVEGKATVSQGGKVVGTVAFTETHPNPGKSKRKDFSAKGQKAERERMAKTENGKRSVRRGEEPRYEVFVNSKTGKSVKYILKPGHSVSVDWLLRMTQ